MRTNMIDCKHIQTTTARAPAARGDGVWFAFDMRIGGTLSSAKAGAGATP